jgi:hypothetical protein
MKDKPNIKTESEEKPAVNSELQKEIFLRLVSSAAADGRFLLGNLPNAQAVVKQGDHLKGVAEILTKCYE